MICQLGRSILNKVTEISQYDSLQGQAPSLNIRTSSVDTEVVDGLSESSWFYRLITLMFGFALVITGDVLYNYPSSPINILYSWSTEALANADEYPYIVLQYVVLLSLCALILAVFTAICLGLTKWTSPPKYVARWQSRFKYLSKRIRSIIRESLWASVTIALVVAVVVFDWYMFDSPNGVFALQALAVR